MVKQRLWWKSLQFLRKLNQLPFLLTIQTNRHKENRLSNRRITNSVLQQPAQKTGADTKALKPSAQKSNPTKSPSAQNMASERVSLTAALQSNNQNVLSTNNNSSILSAGPVLSPSNPPRQAAPTTTANRGEVNRTNSATSSASLTDSTANPNIPEEVRQRMIYRPYVGLTCTAAIKHYLSRSNVLIRVPNVTILVSFATCSLFLVLLVYSIMNDQNFSRVAYAPAIDTVLSFYIIYSQRRPSDSSLQMLHEFFPEIIRALAISLYFIYRYVEPSPVFINLTLIYPICILYRLVNWTRYAKTKYFSVSEFSNQLLTPLLRSRLILIFHCYFIFAV